MQDHSHLHYLPYITIADHGHLTILAGHPCQLCHKIHHHTKVHTHSKQMLQHVQLTEENGFPMSNASEYVIRSALRNAFQIQKLSTVGGMIVRDNARRVMEK